MIRIRNLCFSWNGKPVIDDLNLSIRPGETVLVSGINGTGKTTLLRLLAGVLKPGKGIITFSPDLGEDPRRKIGFISDKMSLYESMRLREAIRFHCAAFGIKEFDDSLIRQIRLAEKSRIRDLSVGQRTIFHLSLILAQKPDVLLVDEVLHAIDPFLRDLFLGRLLENMAERQITLVTINLNYHDIEKLVQRVILMKNGRISIDEPIESLKEKTKRILSSERLESTPVLFSRQFGDGWESYVYPFSPEMAEKLGGRVEGLNLNDIAKAFMGGEYVQ